MLPGVNETVGEGRMERRNLEAVTLVSVIGPVSPQFLKSFVQHYAALGVSDFALAFHFTDDVATSKESELREVLAWEGLEPRIVSRGPWHETTNTEIRDALRNSDRNGWHLLADSDEFVALSGMLEEVVAECLRTKSKVVRGVMQDRVSADGSLVSWDGTQSLDDVFPLGGFLTHAVLFGDPRKIVLARSDVEVAHGNHWSPAEGQALPGIVLPVNHFKWQSGIERELRARVHAFDSGAWNGRTDAVRDEAARFIAFVDANGGRIDTTLASAMFTTADVHSIRSDWNQTGGRVLETWDHFFLTRSASEQFEAGHPEPFVPNL